jgi:hypothetical protein
VTGTCDGARLVRATIDGSATGGSGGKICVSASGANAAGDEPFVVAEPTGVASSALTDAPHPGQKRSSAPRDRSHDGQLTVITGDTTVAEGPSQVHCYSMTRDPGSVKDASHMPAPDSTPRTGRIVLTDADLLDPPAPAPAPAMPPVAQAAAPAVIPAQPVYEQQTAVQPAAPAPAPAAYAAPAPPPPPIAPAMPSAGPHRRMPRWQWAVPSVLAAILLAVLTFFIGQSTRHSQADIDRGLAAQKADLDSKRRAALLDQSRDLRREYKTTLEQRVAAAKEQARADGVEQGKNSGYSDGFSTGTCYTPVTLRNVC